MFQELDEILGFEKSFQTDRRLVVVSRDGRSDSGFILHYLLAAHSKRRNPVVLVNVAQTLAHYRNVAAKSGTNLKTAGGLLECIDCLATPPTCPRTLYQEIGHRLASLGDGPALLLIDDLTMFLSLGWSLAEAIAFVHYCATLHPLCRVVFGAYEPESYDVEARRLLAFLRHTADASIRLQGLTTGYSKDVHGQIRIVEKRKPERRFQYNLEEKRVRVFPHGMSLAVL